MRATPFSIECFLLSQAFGDSTLVGRPTVTNDLGERTFVGVFMRVRIFSQRLLWIYAITITGCEPAPSSDWLLLSEDSEGKPTYIDAEGVHLRDEGVAVYRRVVGDPSAADRVEFVQALDCVNLRWAFLTLDESSLDSIAGMSL